VRRASGGFRINCSAARIGHTERNAGRGCIRKGKIVQVVPVAQQVIKKSRRRQSQVAQIKGVQ